MLVLFRSTMVLRVWLRPHGFRNGFDDVVSTRRFRVKTNIVENAI